MLIEVRPGDGRETDNVTTAQASSQGVGPVASRGADEMKPLVMYPLVN